MSKFKVKYIEISIKETEINARSIDSVRSEFTKSHPKLDTTLYNILTILEDSEYAVKQNSYEIPKSIVAENEYVNEIPSKESMYYESVGNTTIDYRGMNLKTDFGTTYLTSREYNVFYVLLQHIDELCTLDNLMNEIDCISEDIDYRKAISSAVSKIRRKLEKIGSNLTIDTVKGKGYRLRS